MNVLSLVKKIHRVISKKKTIIQVNPELLIYTLYYNYRYQYVLFLYIFYTHNILYISQHSSLRMHHFCL